MVFYRLFIFLYPALAWLLGFFNPKARLWTKGRQGLMHRLAADLQNNQDPIIWVHTASLGEFEQGLPIMESIRKKYPAYKILLTFFSPSGYEIRKNYPGADFIYYLPMDSPKNAFRFFTVVRPSLVLFVKYEYWYYYLREAHNRKIPVLLISGVFRKGQLFFKWYGGFYRKILGFFTTIFVQSKTSADLLRTIPLPASPLISGDTRFDRVCSIAQRFEPIVSIENFCSGKASIIAGSTWTEDDETIAHYANTHPECRFVIAPHDIDSERLQECLSLYKNSLFFSEYEECLLAGKEIPSNIHVLIINNMGMLSRLYHYANICYIGGGFGYDGVHNVLEAAVYGKPVVFGPEYEKYQEAIDLIENGGAFSIKDSLDLERTLDKLFTNIDLERNASTAAAAYVKNMSGATQKIIDYIDAKRLLTN